MALAGASPRAGGTVTLAVYPPSDTTCSGTPYDATTAAAPGASIALPATAAPGVYRWSASYSGDAADDQTSTACTATTTVTPAATALSISATSVTLGANLTATATLAGGVAPTGTITLDAYTGSDCIGIPTFEARVAVDGAGTYASSDFAPAHAGAYTWQATYGGDTNNARSSSACSTSRVAKAATRLAVSGDDGTLGGSVTATATLSSGVAPTGTITFDAYAGDGCSGTPVFEDHVAVAGAGSYPSAGFTPPHAGRYVWQAQYSGDGDNFGSATDCSVHSTVAAAQPTLSATAVATARRGQPLSDAATIAGSHAATGTLVFALYASADCGDTPVFTSDPVSVSGDGGYDSPPYVPAAAGVYHWIATYSGDDDNDATATGCDDPAQTATVTEPAFAISPDGADFGAVELGRSSDARSFTVTNVASGATAQDLHFDADAVALADAGTSGGSVKLTDSGFALRDDRCSGATVAPGASCTFAVVFTPTATGDAQATVTLTDDAPDSPQTLTLRGSGEAPLAPSPTPTASPAPSATPSPAPTPSPRPLPALRFSKVSATRCTTGDAIALRFTLSRQARVTLTLQRRIAPVAKLRTVCPKALAPIDRPAKYGNVRAARARFAGAARERFAVVSAAHKPVTLAVAGKAGANTVSLRSLLRKAKLKPGRYRVVLRAGAATATANFWVLARRR